MKLPVWHCLTVCGEKGVSIPLSNMMYSVCLRITEPRVFAKKCIPSRWQPCIEKWTYTKLLSLTIQSSCYDDVVTRTIQQSFLLPVYHRPWIQGSNILNVIAVERSKQTVKSQNQIFALTGIMQQINKITQNRSKTAVLVNTLVLKIFALTRYNLMSMYHKFTISLQMVCVICCWFQNVGSELTRAQVTVTQRDELGMSSWNRNNARFGVHFGQSRTSGLFRIARRRPLRPWSGEPARRRFWGWTFFGGVRMLWAVRSRALLAVVLWSVCVRFYFLLRIILTTDIFVILRVPPLIYKINAWLHYNFTESASNCAHLRSYMASSMIITVL